MPRLHRLLYCSGLSKHICPAVGMAADKSIRVAIIGQSVFARDVYSLVRKNGHNVVGVFTIPDKNGREVSAADDRGGQLNSLGPAGNGGC